MTTLSHLDPNFSTVAAIEAINEPIMDATQTPGLGECTSPLPRIQLTSHGLITKWIT